MSEFSIDLEALEGLIEEAKASGGSERSNYQLFVERLCGALDLPRPAMAREENRLNDYVFERTVAFKHPDGSKTSGFIDCYRKGRFILEAKQSRKREKARAAQDQLSLLPEDARQFKAGHALRGSRSWDQVMVEARKQAENYARALPVEHGYPPFLLVVDVGHVIEVFADFSGQGKNYAQFPDRQSYRIAMDDLRDPAVQERLRAIWIDPLSLDPTRIAAAVTRDIADRLARIAKRLEGKHDAKAVAEFLMRCLFTMFAEDVGLLPKNGFRDLLGTMRETPQHFVPALEALWGTMDSGGYAPHLNTTLKRFNGALFKTRTALPLDADEINELWIAAGKDWSEVEPAIFGTLLERALDDRERSKLGAHYTPRAYVERLVVPTIIEPLRANWDLVQGQVKEASDKGDAKAALAAVLGFHRRLCTTRVLDPACGTGNFLYVALELMKKLEGEVLDAVAALGGQPDRYSDYPAEAGRDLRGQRLARTGGRFTVDPHQFHGLEVNPRAVPIADLVLWIGYLKWQIKTIGVDAISPPVLDAYGTIREQDAVIAYDRKELLRDESGRPLSRWDGVTKKIHPITGEDVPDPDAQAPQYRYVNPRRALWPEAEFIVGNPPFIGNKRMISRQGEGYVNAVRSSYPLVASSVDYVMYWWWNAAQFTKKSKFSRFGLVTTNKIVQPFNRGVVKDALSGKNSLAIVFAIPDHPWNDEETSAAVRVAFTVGENGSARGELQRLVSENSDGAITLSSTKGDISPNLSLTTSMAPTSRLIACSLLSHQGVIPLGEGFRLTASEANNIGYPNGHEGPAIKPYKIGRDLTQRDQGIYIVDLYGFDWKDVNRKFPRVAQIVLDRVKPERDQNRRPRRRERFWLYADTCEDMRDALKGQHSYIATCRTAKHRTFVRLKGDVLPDAKIVAITVSSVELLSILSSRAHVMFSISVGGRQGVGNDPVYQHSDTFNHFPFPAAIDPTATGSDADLGQREHLRELGERLDAFRKERLAEHPFLTMTGLYNALERLREVEHGYGEPLTPAERDVHQAGLISVLKELHDDIDRAVFSAYGWDDLAPALVGRPGATLPTPHKSPEQEQAEAELLSRLVALNHERAAEEKNGLVRWLRPDYQIPKLGAKVPKAKDEHVGTLDIALPETAERLRWPADGLEQIRLVRDLLAKAPAPTPAEAIETVFDGRSTAKRRHRITEVLETLVATGLARTGDQDGQKRYFLPR